MKSKVILTLGGLFIGLCLTIFRPVPTPTIDNTFIFSDEVENIWEGGINDIQFSFKYSNKTPYINRGLEQGLDIQELKKQLLGKKAHFKFIDHWTPLDFSNSSPPVAYIETDDNNVLYDVIRD